MRPRSSGLTQITLAQKLGCTQQAVAHRVKALAKRQHRSANRILAELIESGLEAREQEKREFYRLADELARSSDPGEQKHLKDELARMTSGA